MNENVAQYLKLLKMHADRVVIAVMYLLLLALLFMWWTESSSEGEAGPGPGTTASIPDVVSQNPNYKSVQAMLQSPDISKSPQIDQVRKYNMFDYKSVKEKEAIEREVNQKYVQAEQAANKGQTEEAKRLLAEILRDSPNHLKAKELNAKLTEPSKPAAGDGQKKPSGPRAPGGKGSAPAGNAPSNEVRI